jgi:hypothetical protein
MTLRNFLGRWAPRAEDACPLCGWWRCRCKKGR